MACYIASNNNRFYVARELSYGAAADIEEAQRFPGVHLRIREQAETPRRRDKTGTRTFQGLPPDLRRRTAFEVKTYLPSREQGSDPPQWGALLESALGGPARAAAGGTASVQGQVLTFQGAHGLSEGMAVTAGGEIRMAAGVLNANQVVLNAPFTPWMGDSAIGGTVSYSLAERLPSVTLYDYWSPATAVHRMVRGAVADELEFEVNGDFHEVAFRGIGAELVDSATAGGAFPAEPAAEDLGTAPVLGHLGQIWLGLGPSQFHTLTQARVRVKNNVEARAREFGSLFPRCVAPGEREVTAEFELYSQDNEAFNELYQAARWRQPVSMLVQMGGAAGQMCGLWLKSFVPETPEFIDEETRLRWRFAASRAQGGAGDELWVAFG